MRSLILISLVVVVVAIDVLLSYAGPWTTQGLERKRGRHPVGPKWITTTRRTAKWPGGGAPTAQPRFAFPNTLPAVSTLWTPEGEHPVGRAAAREKPASPQGTEGSRPSARPDLDEPDIDQPEQELSQADQEQIAARLEELQHQIVSTPAEVVVANHAYGLFELAAIHLSQNPPRLEDARLAVDAMAGLVESLEGRLGEPEKSLHDALAQIRLAYVQISAGQDPTS